jgi:replicative DNA helicase
MKTPHLPHAEKSALSLLGHDPSGLGRHPWDETLFFAHAHALIFRAIQSSASAGLQTDLVSVTNRLEASGHLDDVGGAGAVADVLLTFGCPAQAMLTTLYGDLAGARARRDILQACRDAEADIASFGEALPLAEFAGRIAELANPSTGTERKTTPELVVQVMDEIESRQKPERFAFGLAPLDARLDGGLGRGELAVVAGGTGSGKSVLLGMAALEAATAGKSVLFFSLEMPAVDVIKRMVANLSGYAIPRATDRPAERHVKATIEGLDVISGLPLTVADDARNLAQIEAAAMTARADFIIVDYLQLVETPKADNRELGISEVARRLKSIALSRKVAVLTASQLNDDGRLRESRAIGHHADLVISVDDDGIACTKHRRGPGGWHVAAALRGHLARFEA